MRRVLLCSTMSWRPHDTRAQKPSSRSREANNADGVNVTAHRHSHTNASRQQPHSATTAVVNPNSADSISTPRLAVAGLRDVPGVKSCPRNSNSPELLIDDWRTVIGSWKFRVWELGIMSRVVTVPGCQDSCHSHNPQLLVSAKRLFLLDLDRPNSHQFPVSEDLS